MSKNLVFESDEFTLVLHLYRAMLVELDLTTKDSENTSIGKFHHWLMSTDALGRFTDELTEYYGLDETVLGRFSSATQNPCAFTEYCYIFWPLVSCGHRPEVSRQLLGVKLTMEYTFDGGKCPVCCEIAKFSRDQAEAKLTGPYLASVMRAAFDKYTNHISDNGIDELLEAVEAGDADFFLNSDDPA